MKNKKLRKDEEKEKQLKTNLKESGKRKNEWQVARTLWQAACKRNSGQQFGLGAKKQALSLQHGFSMLNTPYLLYDAQLCM